jgi:hypothetical protein
MKVYGEIPSLALKAPTDEYAPPMLELQFVVTSISLLEAEKEVKFLMLSCRWAVLSNEKVLVFISENVGGGRGTIRALLAKGMLDLSDLWDCLNFKFLDIWQVLFALIKGALRFPIQGDII